MDRLGDSDKRSISRPNSPGRTPPCYLLSILFHSTLLSKPSLFFASNLCSLQTDKGSLRNHFVHISACKCVYVYAHFSLSLELISNEGWLPEVPLKNFQWLLITYKHTKNTQASVFCHCLSPTWVPVFILSFKPMSMLRSETQLLFRHPVIIPRHHRMCLPQHIALMRLSIDQVVLFVLDT